LLAIPSCVIKGVDDNGERAYKENLERKKKGMFRSPCVLCQSMFLIQFNFTPKPMNSHQQENQLNSFSLGVQKEVFCSPGDCSTRAAVDSRKRCGLLQWLTLLWLVEHQVRSRSICRTGKIAVVDN
jgi:hypothetical protein